MDNTNRPLNHTLSCPTYVSNMGKDEARLASQGFCDTNFSILLRDPISSVCFSAYYIFG